ncbi:site-specific integrase [Shewanella xiamenensis]|uniref:site-specific integrase n=1 Tax=Shewanella xiamenensis TaxID=332186 RepID=UPI002948D33E|nr:site-specific integrase [Shewanella xiamenensis]MDV5246781.1 site-specific integrase [Shewanella xiamenensis]MDV5247238.1 site-specific integrase [Shewanella xiamenensis]
MIGGNKQLVTTSNIDGFKSRLLNLAQNGLWSELEEEVVSFQLDGSPISVFSDGIWDFTPYKVGTESTLLNFQFPGGAIYPQLVRELKVVALAYVYHSRRTYRIGSIRGKIDCLKRLIIALFQAETFSLDGLTIENLKSLIKNGQYSPRELDIGPINNLNDLGDFLPFEVNFSERLTLRKLRVTQLQREQHPVIPLRVYLSALSSYTDEVRHWHPYKEQLEQAVQTAFEYEQYQANRMLKLLRNGQCGVSQVFNNADKRYFKFISELKKHKVPLVDHGTMELWDALWDKCEPQIRTDFYEPFPVVQIGNKQFTSHSEIKVFCRKLDTKCRYLILCLSGMRSNELLQITPEFGAQVISLDGIDIHLFHTRQQKITPGYQGHNDVYVTTRIGHIAFELLNALNRPVRRWLQANGQKGWLLNSLKRFRLPVSISSSSNVLNSLTSLFSKENNSFSIELNSDDIEMLRRSDPEKTFNIGDRWHLTPHQLRRSLAYYLVGMQLADYPQLKQQFSHYSIAMTMYYARNASSFGKMYHDLELEKVRQQARLYSDLASKAMHGVKLGGGQGKNMFSERFTDRDISPAYFEKEIKSGRKHIHALAPGMYCINHTCSMRIGIDLSECTDCDWSIIESAAYAKAARQESIHILEALKLRNELSADIAAFHSVRIRAAEKVMADMELEFEQYQPPAYASDWLISSTV